MHKPQNLRYPLGTLARDLLDFCGGFSGTPSKIIMGGPMMGHSVTKTEIPLTKGSNGLVAVGEDHDMDPPETPCIRCNRCVEVCPMYLVPYGIDRYWRKGNINGCHRLHAQSCINCGCCTYICPAARHLAENIVQAKNKLQERKQTHG